MTGRQAERENWRTSDPVAVRRQTERKCLGGCGKSFYSIHPPSIKRLCRQCQYNDYSDGDYRVAL